MTTPAAPLTLVAPERSGPVTLRARPNTGGAGHRSLPLWGGGIGRYVARKVSAWKREFMLSVFDLSINRSHLSSQMQDMMAAGTRIHPEAKATMKQVDAAKRDIRRGGVKAFAPIP